MQTSVESGPECVSHLRRALQRCMWPLAAMRVYVPCLLGCPDPDPPDDTLCIPFDGTCFLTDSDCLPSFSDSWREIRSRSRMISAPTFSSMGRGDPCTQQEQQDTLKALEAILAASKALAKPSPADRRT